MFINEKIYDKAIKFLTMGLYEKMLKRQKEDRNAFFNIVGLSAYQTLTTADAIGYIQIPLDNVLILKDIEVESAPLPAAVVSSVEVGMPEAETIVDKNGNVRKKSQKKKYRCEVKYTEQKIKNVLYDGMGLIDDSWFPEGMNGFIYCRSHFFKSCLFLNNPNGIDNMMGNYKANINTAFAGIELLRKLEKAMLEKLEPVESEDPEKPEEKEEEAVPSNQWGRSESNRSVNWYYPSFGYDYGRRNPYGYTSVYPTWF